MKRLFMAAILTLVSLATPLSAAPNSAPRSVQMEQYEPDTIVISTQDRRLYYKTVEGRVLSYPIGVGRDGFTWSGSMTITQMKEWPDWVPPPEMISRQPYLPRHMFGGLGNPLGARALYLGNTLYRIHGSNESKTIGYAVSSGWFRMHNRDVVNLYELVRIGTKVVVLK